MLLKTVTAFTLAHSITLAVATFGIARVSAAPLNAAIALSILFLGPEIVRRWRGETSFTIRRPWVVAFAFGLLQIHWPKAVERLPGHVVGTLGAFWTIQRVVILLKGVA